MRKITTVLSALTILIFAGACSPTSAASGTPDSTNPPPATSPGKADPGQEKPCYGMSGEACETFYLTNAERVKQGLPELLYSHRCLLMAQDQSQDMVLNGYFDHARPASGSRPAETFSQRAQRFGVGNGAGENIAMASSPEQTVLMWMNSPAHRKNILNPKYKSFAVGYQDGLYTQDFWVNIESP